MNWSCLFGLHNYEKWTDIEKGEICKRHVGYEVDCGAVASGDWYNSGTYIIQHRLCATCGKKQLRTEKAQL